MKIRWITVPKDKKAEIDLDYDQASHNQLIEIKLNQSQFDQLWNNEIFKLINSVSGSLIDDFESETITNNNKILNVIIKLQEKNKTICNPELKQLTVNIINLFEEAYQRKTNIHFDF